VYISLFEKIENVEKFEILRIFYGMLEIEVDENVVM
jgi:hypothetical protein